MNRLAKETSPYLLQHAENPVDWYPWGDEAFEKAARENKPMFLSVGYATCYWCHVMAKESFDDPGIASILNRHFVPVKVDREERPDIDQLYMRAYQRMSGGAGGWPLSLFLTPEGRPFFGGTYFPKERRGGLPGFGEVLLAVARAWDENEGRLRAEAERIATGLAPSFSVATEGRLEAKVHTRVLEGLRHAFDPQNGGFGLAPKFPQAPILAYLVRRAWLGEGEARSMLEKTLEAMAAGGIYDQLGGGFHRYSVDAFWQVPHFEKMLYDNAQLAWIFLAAWRLTQNARFRTVAEETLDFLLREMRGEQGGFYSALDAGEPGAEGAFYIWSWDEWTAALGEAAEPAAAVFGVQKEGNWEDGKNVLWRRGEPRPGWRRKLLRRRDQRPRPAVDTKVLADWNGLALFALAEAGRLLSRPDYLEAAEKTARFLLETLRRDGLIRHAWRAGRLREEAYLADQAAVGLGLLALHHATGKLAWLEAAGALAGAAMRFYDDRDGRFYDALHATPLGRPSDPIDGAHPSGSALAAELLLRLAPVFDRPAWEGAARRALKGLEAALAQSPLGFGAHAGAHLFGLEGTELVLVLPAQSLEPAIRHGFFPLTATVFGPEAALPVLRDRAPGKAYLCRSGACRLPAEDWPGLLAEFRALYPSMPEQP